MTCLLDVNVLMALLWENHEHHLKARAWLKGISTFATCPVAQLGFARVSSHPLLGYGMTPEDAFGVLRQLLADSCHHFVPDDLSCADRVVRTDQMAGPNQITDRYLIALARSMGAVWPHWMNHWPGHSPMNRLSYNYSDSGFAFCHV